MNVWRNRILGLLAAMVIFGADRWIKWQLMDIWKLPEVDSIPITSFFDLRFTQNFGVSLGLLQAQSAEMRWLLVAVTAGIALVVTIWMMRERKMWDIFALALVLGGALGNIRDRVFQGYVIDYADFHIGEFRPFLIFNLADAAITIGVLIILARSFLLREKHDTPSPDTAADPALEN
ncbi:MAG: signal peptidase II [Novosphingobium sp.]